jgi:hypothetical protein
VWVLTDAAQAGAEVHFKSKLSTGLGRCDRLIDFAPLATAQRPGHLIARDASGVSADAAWQELSGRRRVRDKD